MQCLRKTALVVGALAAGSQVAPVSAATDAARVTPVQKVLELMDGMLATGKKEKHEEQVQFASYKQFCDDTSTEKTRDIEEANDKIEVLKADIEKYTANAAKLTKEIAVHDEDIATWTGDQKAATKVRDIEHADYVALHKDYTESIDALQRAIAVLKKQAHDRPQAEASLVQVKSMRMIPDEAKQTIDAFLQQPVEAPSAEGYEFQSHGVIDMLEKLLGEFSAELTKTQNEERESKHAYDMLMQDMTAQIQEATQDREDKSASKAKNLQMKASAEGDVHDTTEVRNADTRYLEDLTATCQQKASDFENRQQLRAEELEAIAKAVEIIGSDSVSGSAEKHLPSLVQDGTAAPALAMLRSGSSQDSLLQSRAVEFLNERGRTLGSRVLATVAMRASADPFVKVKKMVKDLIARLMEEANEESDHKGWCDAELSTNEQTRKEKTEAVETLHAEVDQLDASIAKLTEDIAELTQSVADLDAAMSEATSIRAAEKAENTETVADAQEAQTAVSRALAVLKEFYTKAGDATALVQQEPAAPEIFESSYKGMQSTKGGVVGMLEVIESDFARLEADTKSSEAAAAKEYDTFMTDSKADKQAKSTDIEHKTAKQQDQEQALQVKNEDLEGTQKELDAALQYFDKLKPSCVDVKVSYEERVDRRNEEIKSLQEALHILSGEELA